MYVMNDALIVLGGAATPVQRLMMALAWADHADEVIAREESATGPKMYGASPGSVSKSSMRRYSFRYGTMTCETDVTVGPLRAQTNE